MKPIIRVDGLSKKYRIGGKRTPHGTFRDALAWAAAYPWRRLLGKEKPATETLWALRDVSFEVAPGEVVGIIGRNGAGKSTLLKVLSRITEPTAGRVELRGRVASLLEVGTGFHPELSGRENVYLNGAILGMTRREIRRKFDEIVAFAEIDRFLDTPVKHYSSGMYVRLAFAVAAHLEPEVLVVDEVLAVGDASFQKKCLGKMGEVADLGRTVLFVSHNMVALQKLCNRGVWLVNGTLARDGNAAEVVRHYLGQVSGGVTEQVWDRPEDAPGNDKVRLRAARVVAPAESEGLITVATPFHIEFDYQNLQPHRRLNLSMILHREDESCAFVTTTIREPAWDGRLFPTGVFRSVCHIPGDLLNNGVYRVSILVVEDTTRVLYRLDYVLTFEVQDSTVDRGNYHGEWIGAVRPRLRWETQMLGATHDQVPQTLC